MKTKHGSKVNLSFLPSVDRLMRNSAISAMAAEHGHDVAKVAVREALAAARLAAVEGLQPTDEHLAADVLARGRKRIVTRLTSVINLTGTVVHTNLGRSLLCAEAVESVARAMQCYTALEYDLGTGKRGDRDRIVESLLIELTGAEAATVVNNNAAAVVLTLAALAARKEAVISHSELIEIGGSFRMPDVMRAAGCKLVTIGTTNCTHLADYTAAITSKTGAIVRANWSNYSIEGFTKFVSDDAIASVARQRGVPFVVDLGSGALVDLSEHGLPREPLPQDALAAGASVVTFSGDKLLGGPQAGIIVGERDLIAKIRKHPLKRAMRCSKMVFAALEGTLRVYASRHRVTERLPVLRLLTRSASDIRETCERALPALSVFAGPLFRVRIEPCASQVGSGSLPVDRLPSYALVATPERVKDSGRMLRALTDRLQSLPAPAIGRVHGDALWLDARCLLPEDEAVFISQLGAA